MQRNKNPALNSYADVCHARFRFLWVPRTDDGIAPVPSLVKRKRELNGQTRSHNTLHPCRAINFTLNAYRRRAESDCFAQPRLILVLPPFSDTSIDADSAIPLLDVATTMLSYIYVTRMTWKKLVRFISHTKVALIIRPPFFRVLLYFWLLLFSSSFTYSTFTFIPPVRSFYIM